MKAYIIKNEDKLLAASSYVFFFPAIYIALTDKRKLPYDAEHAAQAITLWAAYAVIYILIRIAYSFLSGIWYFILYDLLVKLAHIAMWGYAAYCGLLAYNENKVEIPHISDYSKKLL